MWETAVELVRVLIVSVASICAGSLGAAILAVSFGMRLALLPLTLRLAREARARQQRLAALRPELERLRRRYANDPARLWRETRALHEQHGIRLFTPTGMLGMAVQFPLFAALFAATRRGLGVKVRFLWIAELARPDALLALVVAVLTGLVAAGAMGTSGATEASANLALVMAVILGGMTLLFLWSASSAVALSVGAGALVSALQTWILARDRRRELER